ncbi:MAG: hypothetical protein IPM38_13765, partial [Ignavibacteria bacterium]|nr:hypothetical protein [Ignavibacteria bacterium]
MQTTGKTARNVNGLVIMYADKVTDSMDKVIRHCEEKRNSRCSIIRIIISLRRLVLKT